MAWCIASALAVFIAAHVVLVAGLARRRTWTRALLAMVVPPLAPWWGYGAGLRAAAITWCAALALYALGVIVA
ncbi:MAG: hypothetical protein ABSE49_04480 [Polyangiaceae bacterium]|jgi:uncharacterized membrane protein YqaE (UPF0057 family)